MSAQGMFAVSRGLELASSINTAFEQQAYAELQIGVMERQMDEIEVRSKMELANIAEKSEKVQATQQAAFISAGVELSGSAMEVLSDTLNDAAQAAYIRQRETDYDLGSMGMQMGQLKKAASNETLMLKVASSTIGSVAGYAGDMKSYNRMNTRQRGAAGIGSTDSFGGTTDFSTAYINS